MSGTDHLWVLITSVTSIILLLCVLEVKELLLSDPLDSELLEHRVELILADVFLIGQVRPAVSLSVDADGHVWSPQPHG